MARSGQSEAMVQREPPPLPRPHLHRCFADRAGRLYVGRGGFAGVAAMTRRPQAYKTGPEQVGLWEIVGLTAFVLFMLGAVWLWLAIAVAAQP